MSSASAYSSDRFISNRYRFGQFDIPGAYAAKKPLTTPEKKIYSLVFNNLDPNSSLFNPKVNRAPAISRKREWIFPGNTNMYRLTSPKKIFDAPDASYLPGTTRLDWSVNHDLAIALYDSCYVKTESTKPYVLAQKNKPIKSIQWNPTGALIAVSTGTELEIRKQDSVQTKISLDANENLTLNALKWICPNTLLFNKNGSVIRCDLRANNHDRLTETKDTALISVHPAANRIALGSSRQVSIFDLRVNKSYNRFEHGSELIAIDFDESNNSNQIITAGANTLKLTREHEATHSFSYALNDAVTSLTHNDDVFILGHESGNISFHDKRDLIHLCDYVKHDEPIINVCAAKCSSEIMALGADESLTLWDAPTRHKRKRAESTTARNLFSSQQLR